MTTQTDLPNEGETARTVSDMPYPSSVPRFGYDSKIHQFGQKVGMAHETAEDVHAAQQRQIFALTDALHARHASYALVKITTQTHPAKIEEVTAEMQGITILAAGLSLMEAFIEGGRSALESRIRNPIGDREELRAGLSAAKAHVASLNVFGA